MPLMWPFVPVGGVHMYMYARFCRPLDTGALRHANDVAVWDWVD